MKNKNVKKNKTEKVVIVKPESQKNKKPNKPKQFPKPSYRMIMTPIFVAVALNLMFSVGLSIGTSQNNTKHLATNTTAAQISAQNQVLTAKEMLFSAINNLENSEHYTVTANGEVKSFVNQKVRAKKVYDGKTHFTETTTSGYKNIATRIYANGNSIKTIKSKGDLSFKNTHKPTNYTPREFKEKFSITPEQVISYDINSISVVSTTTPKKVGNNYTFSVSLHPKLATKNYSKNIKQATKLSNEPAFNFVNLNVIVDENCNFVKIEIEEEFYIKILGISKLCKSNIMSNFDFNKPEHNAIPKL